MNRQRKVVITVTYNELGVIVDTKAEELDSSAQPNLQPTCNQLATDTISRQAAIDALHMHLMYRMGTDSNKKRLDEWINGVPSVQPDHVAGISKKVDGDCISRKEALKICRRYWHPTFNPIMEEIENLPPAQPEILACGEGELNAPDTNVGDMISRQAAIDALARMMPRSYTPDGSHPADEEIFRAQEVFADCIEALEILPSAAPSTAHTTETTAETTAPATGGWIPVERELPDDLAEVNVTWVNHEPEPYYESIKSKPFTASAVYYEGKWYWYSSVCADVLAEYGRNDVDKVDDAIEITAWRPFPEPYRGGDE